MEGSGVGEAGTEGRGWAAGGMVQTIPPSCPPAAITAAVLPLGLRD
jgi:hypothetical protein